MDRPRPRYTDLSPEWLAVDPVNPRVNVGDVDELAASIGDVGILNPLIIRHHPTDPELYGVLSGSRRLAAARKAGLDVVPCLSHDHLDDRRALIIATAENIGRKAMNPIEEGRAFRAMAELGMTQAEVARACGTSVMPVSAKAQLLELPDEVQARIAAGELSWTRAYSQLLSSRRDGDPVKTRPRVRGGAIPEDLVDDVREFLRARRWETRDDVVRRALRRELATPTCELCPAATAGRDGKWCPRHVSASERARTVRMSGGRP